MPRAALTPEAKAWLAELEAKGIDPCHLSVRIETTVTRTITFNPKPPNDAVLTETEKDEHEWDNLTPGDQGHQSH
jgi:hypothetical protein